MTSANFLKDCELDFLDVSSYTDAVAQTTEASEAEAC